MSESNRFTCAGCGKIAFINFPMNGAMAGCLARNGALVPQHYAYGEITLKRIPLECPLNDGVNKSPDTAHPKHWVTLEIEDL